MNALKTCSICAEKEEQLQTMTKQRDYYRNLLDEICEKVPLPHVAAGPLTLELFTDTLKRIVKEHETFREAFRNLNFGQL